MLKKVLFLLISLKIVAIAIPMESLSEYNLVLVHGAGSHWGGVVSREYVQGNFYNGDVDKIITLDSLHEGTGALNMQVCLLLFCSKIRRKSLKEKSL